MTLKERIEICRFLSQVYNNPKYAHDVGIEDKTHFTKTSKSNSKSGNKEKQ